LVISPRKKNHLKFTIYFLGNVWRSEAGVEEGGQGGAGVGGVSAGQPAVQGQNQRPVSVLPPPTGDQGHFFHPHGGRQGGSYLQYSFILVTYLYLLSNVQNFCFPFQAMEKAVEAAKYKEQEVVIGDLIQF
jgi:hypothetical protein